MMTSNPASHEAALAAADRLRDGDAGARAVAMDAYAAHADAIDPANLDGCTRVGWLLTQGRAIDPRLEDLVKRAAATAIEPNVREIAEVVLFQFPLRRGEVTTAERHLRSLLARHRRSGSPREIGVLNDLALVYQSSQREFETLVLARCALDVATAQDAPLGIAVARARMMWALERLEEWSALEAQADSMLRLLPDLDACHHGPALRAVHTALRAIRMGHRDWDGARLQHAQIVTAGPPASPETDDAFDGAMLEAQIAVASGRPADAAAIALPASSAQPVGTRRWLTATDLLVRSAAAAGGPRSAIGTAMELHVAITSPHAARHGVSSLLAIATGVGVALGEHPTAALFFETASELLVRRVEEIRECVSSVEELSRTAEQERAMLARHRTRYVADHRRALAAIAQIYDDPGVPRPPQIERLADHDRIRICAWCLTMRTPDGRTLPIGHLLPDSARLGVTHGICDDCRDGVGV
ncbi:MAG: hypothetical protein K8T90_04830 [Planctomycetes bacterium]|nr:hypothetical protein [Planctomycetota bacterium]